MIKFNVVTMKDGEINIEEKPELSELLSQSMREHAEFTKTKKERAMELPEGFYTVTIRIRSFLLLRLRP